MLVGLPLYFRNINNYHLLMRRIDRKILDRKMVFRKNENKEFRKFSCPEFSCPFPHKKLLDRHSGGGVYREVLEIVKFCW
jgi:hypothetical protein